MSDKVPPILKYTHTDGTIAESLEGMTITDFDKVKAGESKTVKYLIENLLGNRVELVPISEDADLHVIPGTKILDAGASTTAEITFSPPKGRVTPLNSKYGFEVIIG